MKMHWLDNGNNAGKYYTEFPRSLVHHLKERSSSMNLNLNNTALHRIHDKKYVSLFLSNFYELI